MESRREFLKFVGTGGAAMIASRTAGRADPLEFNTLGPAQNSGNAWDEVPRILACIKPPVFPNREFMVSNFGAVGDNKIDCTEAFRKAITACRAAGGGRVVVPKGEFLTGAIQLKSDVN